MPPFYIHTSVIMLHNLQLSELLFYVYLFQGEGVAYRGRVLIELSTQLDDKTDKKMEDISNDEILVAQVTASILHSVDSWKKNHLKLQEIYINMISQSLFLQNRIPNACFFVLLLCRSTRGEGSIPYVPCSTVPVCFKNPENRFSLRSASETMEINWTLHANLWPPLLSIAVLFLMVSFS